MRHILILAALIPASLGLASCGTIDEQPSAEPAGIGVEALRLPGDYRVANVDGASVDMPHGVSASITDDWIDLQSDCIRLAWTYSFDGQALTTSPEPVRSCRRALLPQEQAISTAFDAATTVSRTPNNGLEFSGGGHSVTLFSQ